MARRIYETEEQRRFARLKNQERYRAAHPDRIRNYGKLFNLRHPQKAKEYADKFASLNPHKEREYQEKKRNKITQLCAVDAEFALSTRQNRLAAAHKSRGMPKALRPMSESCECCGGPPNGRTRHRFHLDHDHDTGQFRGWLCARCNLAAGSLGDTLEGARNLVRYLEKAYG